MAGQPVSCRGEVPTGSRAMKSAAALSLLTSRCGRIDRPGPQDTSALLAKVVERQIIPRLMLAHKPQPAPVPTYNISENRLSAAYADVFTRMVLSSEVEELLSYAQELLKGRLSTRVLYFEFLSAAARRLGDYWNDDRISLAEVTIGLGRLQQVVRRLVLDTEDGLQDGAGERSAYLASCPGEQHSFGVALIDDFLSHAGWKTRVEPAASSEQIAGDVGRQWFDLICLNANCSVSCDAQLEVVASTIISVRQVSRNRDITVIVGGRLFHEHPDLALSVGADDAVSGERVAMLAI